MKNCKLCNGTHTKIIYKGQIRNGGLGQYTMSEEEMYQCEECGVIWHEPIKDTKEYYESKEYRNSLEGSSEAEVFYKLHDKETLDKLLYTGTDIYRNRIVADIGCGCGAFLDFLKGVASEIIAVEPSETYREIMGKKGFQTYAYMEDAIRKWKGSVDVITSFDVIEHVEDPTAFMKNIGELLSGGGRQ